MVRIVDIGYPILSQLRPGRAFLIVVYVSILAVAQTAQSAEEFKPNTVGLFLGATDEDGGSTEFTYGLEYGYKFTPRFGAGVVYERIDDGHDGDGVEVLVGSFYFSPAPGWRLGLGAGIEDIDGETETLYRFGIAYHFHVGGFGVAPVVNLDEVDGKNPVVFGIALTRSF